MTPEHCDVSFDCRNNPCSYPHLPSPRSNFESAIDQMTLANDFLQFGIELDVPLGDGATVFRRLLAEIKTSPFRPLVDSRPDRCGTEVETSPPIIHVQFGEFRQETAG
jgi:hypothetical protein